MQKKIGVLGCGWLGLPLAELLVKNDFDVAGTTTSPEKLPMLAARNIQPFLLDLSQSEFSADQLAFLDQETLVVNIPPKRNSGNSYSQQIGKLSELLRHSPVKNVLFVSSTSVYKPSDEIITENSALDEENARELIAAEQLISAPENPWQTTILRFAGLFGPGRQPGRFLAGKTDLPDPNSPVNLIHLTDCVQLILEIIAQEKWGETFNACADTHPSRKEFYEAAAKAAGLVVPVFAAENQPAGKVKLISNQKLKAALNYNFRFPDLILALVQE